MASELAALMRLVEADEHDFVIAFMGEEGIHWRGQSESACRVMQSILGDGAKVFSKQEFLDGLREADGDEK